MCDRMKKIHDTIEEAIICPICLNRFMKPKGLPCGHTYCFHCLIKLCGQKKKIQCPQCRRNIEVPPDGASGFPDDHTMVKVLEIRAKSNACKDCMKFPGFTLCDKCRQKLYVDGPALEVKLKKKLDKVRDDMYQMSTGSSKPMNPQEAKAQWYETTEEVKEEVLAMTDVFDSTIANLLEKKRIVMRNLDHLIKIQKELCKVSKGEAEPSEITKHLLAEIPNCKTTKSLKEMADLMSNMNRAINTMLAGEELDLSYIYDAKSLHETKNLLGRIEEAHKHGVVPSDDGAVASTSKDVSTSARVKNATVDEASASDAACSSGDTECAAEITPNRFKLEEQLAQIQLAAYHYPDTGATSATLEDTCSTIAVDQRSPATATVKKKRSRGRGKKSRNSSATTVDGDACNSATVEAAVNNATEVQVDVSTDSKTMKNGDEKTVEMDSDIARSSATSVRESGLEVSEVKDECSTSASVVKENGNCSSTTDVHVIPDPPQVIDGQNATITEEGSITTPEDGSNSVPLSTSSSTTSVYRQNQLPRNVNYFDKQTCTTTVIGGPPLDSQKQLKAPLGADYSVQGNCIYVADTTKHIVMVYDVNGHDGKPFCTAFRPVDVAVNQDHVLVLTPTCMYAMTPHSELAFTINTVNEHNSFSVIVCHENHIIILDRKTKTLMFYDDKGNVERELCLEGLVNQPNTFAVNKNGLIYITDRGTETTPTCVKVLSWDGALVRQFAETDEIVSDGICVDGDDYVCISRLSGDRTDVYGPDDQYVCSFGSPGEEPGCLQCPFQVRMMPDGRVLVVDTGNDRIQIF